MAGHHVGGEPRPIPRLVITAPAGVIHLHEILRAKIA